MALWLLPTQWLLAFSLLAALAGLWLIASHQVLSIGSFVVVSVGMNAVSRDLDPTRTLIEYILLLFVGVGIGLLLGFTVVPHRRPDRVEERVHQARTTTGELLRLAATLAQRAPQPDATSAPVRRFGVPADLVKPLVRMRTAAVNLASPLIRADERAGVSADDRAALATRFETLAVVGLLEAGQKRLTAQTLSAAADALDRPGDQIPSGDVEDAGPAEFVQLAEGVGRTSTEFVAACAELTRGSA